MVHSKQGGIVYILCLNCSFYWILQKVTCLCVFYSTFLFKILFLMFCHVIGMDGVKTLVMHSLPVETRCYLPFAFSTSFALTC